MGASQLLFDGGLFILSNLGNLCGALEGLVKATEFGDKKGTKRHFPAPQRISDRISRRRCRIVTRKGAAIYEFHGESEFESESV